MRKVILLFSLPFLAAACNPLTKNTEPPTVRIPSDDISWKTYNNNDYGFELQYPADWVVTDLKDLGLRINQENRFPQANPDNPETLASVTNSFVLLVRPVLPGQEAAFRKEIEENSNLEIADHKAYRKTEANSEGFHTDTITFLRGNILYQVRQQWIVAGDAALAAANLPKKDEAFKILNQILFSIKFTR